MYARHAGSIETWSVTLHLNSLLNFEVCNAIWMLIDVEWNHVNLRGLAAVECPRWLSHLIYIRLIREQCQVKKGMKTCGKFASLCHFVLSLSFVCFSRERESARTFGFPARQVQMGGLRWRLWALSWKTFFVVPRFCQNVPKAMPLSDVKTKSFKWVVETSLWVRKWLRTPWESWVT